MRAVVGPLLLAVALAAASPCRAGCEDAARALFGFGLGPMAGYVDTLRPGLHREGTGRLVPEVGIESLQGQAGGVAWERVMAFHDHGRFFSVIAVGSIPADADHGFATITRQVAQASGATPATADDKAVFACMPPYELRVEVTRRDSSPRVTVVLTDVAARAASRRYVEAWCADPEHKSDPSACAR
jgi:hypothetical protein